jgi:hypothetical protein
MKYEYKMIMLNNDDMWKQLGIQKGVWDGNVTTPVPMPFADELGEDGFEMFQVVQYGLESCYYFRKEIETSSDIRKRYS